MIALLLPFKIQLTSQIRTFERFLGDERADAKQYFLQFVKVIHQSLGNEVAYIVLGYPNLSSAWVGAAPSSNQEYELD